LYKPARTKVKKLEAAVNKHCNRAAVISSCNNYLTNLVVVIKVLYIAKNRRVAIARFQVSVISQKGVREKSTSQRTEQREQREQRGFRSRGAEEAEELRENYNPKSKIQNLKFPHTLHPTPHTLVTDRWSLVTVMPIRR
jgi:hypothetical protein